MVSAVGNALRGVPGAPQDAAPTVTLRNGTEAVPYSRFRSCSATRQESLPQPAGAKYNTVPNNCSAASNSRDSPAYDAPSLSRSVESRPDLTANRTPQDPPACAGASLVPGQAKSCPRRGRTGTQSDWRSAPCRLLAIRAISGCAITSRLAVNSEKPSVAWQTRSPRKTRGRRDPNPCTVNSGAILHRNGRQDSQALRAQSLEVARAKHCSIPEQSMPDRYRGSSFHRSPSLSSRRASVRSA